jgi:hypothetical protein
MKFILLAQAGLKGRKGRQGLAAGQQERLQAGRAGAGHVLRRIVADMQDGLGRCVKLGGCGLENPWVRFLKAGLAGNDDAVKIMSNCSSRSKGRNDRPNWK